jgi:hypothetical protein
MRQFGHGYDLTRKSCTSRSSCAFRGFSPRASPDLVPTVDVFPTLLELCGVKPKGDIEGRSPFR